MSQNGYYGDFKSLADEKKAYDKHMNEQEPEAVPCFKCNNSMYKESEIPEENICENCKIIK